MHLSMLTPRGGGGRSGICGVFDHQLHPHHGDFDQQFEPNDFFNIVFTGVCTTEYHGTTEYQSYLFLK